MIIIFESIEAANEILYDVAATPAGVWLWCDPDDTGWNETIFDPKTSEKSIVHHDPVNIIQLNHAADGRVALEFAFSRDDEKWLRKCLEDDAVIFADKLPENWYKEK